MYTRCLVSTPTRAASWRRASSSGTETAEDNETIGTPKSSAVRLGSHGRGRIRGAEAAARDFLHNPNRFHGRTTVALFRARRRSMMTDSDGARYEGLRSAGNDPHRNLAVPRISAPDRSRTKARRHHCGNIRPGQLVGGQVVTAVAAKNRCRDLQTATDVSSRGAVAGRVRIARGQQTAVDRQGKHHPNRVPPNNPGPTGGGDGTVPLVNSTQSCD